MPFERFDGRSQRSGQRMHTLRKLKPYLFASAGVLVTFELFARSSITRSLSDTKPRTNIGWQSFLPAYNYRGSSSSSAQSSNSTDLDLLPSPGQSDYWDDLDDWGNDNDAYEGFNTEPEELYWDPFILHRRPITEITAKACIWPPSVYDTCMPDSTLKEDSTRGKWLRVEKDINMRVGVYYLYLFYRRLPYGSNAETVRDFQILTVKDEPTKHLLESDGWHMINQDVRDGVWPRQETAHLYYRTAPRSDGNRSDEVNELDVVWGSSGTLYGWQRMGRDFAEPRDKKKELDQDEGAELMWRKGTPQAPKAKLPLTFSTDGNFKILQIADLHFSVGKGKCLDSDWPGCNGDKGSDLITLDWLQSVLDEEKPDLIILSGDQLNGQDTSYSSESVILKVAKLFESRQVPWTVVLGNHDSEKTTLTRYGQFVMMQALPYFIGEAGPIEVDGEGNYLLKIYSADDSRTQLLTLYFLDSHGYKSSWNVFSYAYDHIKDSQINWFKQQSQKIKKIERPYAPPVLEDSTFGGIADDLAPVGTESTVRRRGMKGAARRLPTRQAVDATSILKKPNAMAIFHIPLKEVYDQKPDTGSDGKPLTYGSFEEGRGAPKDGDFFQKGLVKQTELGSDTDVDMNSEDIAALQTAKPEVKVILNGHNHVTDSCTRLSGIWSCFAGGSSYSGYSARGFDRRIRVFQVSDYGETITTYKILDTHTDHSGTSAASHEDVGSKSEDGAVQATEEEAKKEAEAFLDVENALNGDDNNARRQGHQREGARQSGSHEKVDVLILVGEGAPQ